MLMRGVLKTDVGVEPRTDQHQEQKPTATTTSLASSLPEVALGHQFAKGVEHEVALIGTVLINDWDQCGLIALGAPTDEYQDEVMCILARAHQARTPDAMARLIAGIFCSSLALEVFSVELCLPVATQLVAALWGGAQSVKSNVGKDRFCGGAASCDQNMSCMSLTTDDQRSLVMTFAPLRILRDFEQCFAFQRLRRDLREVMFDAKQLND